MVNVPSGSCEEIDERTPQDYCGKDEGPYPARMTNPPTSPTPRLISIDRQQILLRTVDVEKLIDEDHSARSVWELVGRLDLGLYDAQIEAVEGGAGRNHTTPSCWSVFGCTPTVGESVCHEKWRGSASLNQVFNGSVGCKRSAIGRCPASARETRQLWMICSCKCSAC